MKKGIVSRFLNKMNSEPTPRQQHYFEVTFLCLSIIVVVLGFVTSSINCGLSGQPMDSFLKAIGLFIALLFIIIIVALSTSIGYRIRDEELHTSYNEV